MGRTGSGGARAADPAAPPRLVNAVRWNPVRPDVLATASADKTVAVWRCPRTRTTTARSCSPSSPGTSTTSTRSPGCPTGSG
ncbi:hypothetical protein ACFQV4_22775 [Streptomyces thermocarboxydus]